MFPLFSQLDFPISGGKYQPRQSASQTSLLQIPVVVVVEEVEVVEVVEVVVGMLEGRTPASVPA